MRRSEQPRSLSHSHIRPSYATGPFGYPTLMHIARSSSPRSSLRAPRATSPTFPWLSRALGIGSAQDDADIRGSSRERSCDARSSTRVQSPRAAADSRGESGTHPRRRHARPGCSSAAHRELSEDMRGVDGECAPKKKCEATSCAQTRQTVKRACPPHLEGLPRTGSGKGASKEMQTHLNFVSPPSMRFRELRFKQQLGRRALRRRFAHLKTLCSKSTSS